jgi:hypothetical protein
VVHDVKTKINTRRRTPWLPWIIAWVGAAVLGVANGVARATLYEKRIGASRAHYVSTAALLLLLTTYVRWLSSVWPVPSRAAALRIGGFWSGLTIAFEFGFGRFVARESWSALLGQYNFARGKVWALIPLWMAVGPAVLPGHLYHRG